MSSPHINARIRAHMYANVQHKVIWVAAVVVSAGLLAPALFFVAAKKRLVTMAVPAIYAAVVYGSAFAESAFGNPKNWAGGVLTITTIIAAVQAATLDTDWKADQ